MWLLPLQTTANRSRASSACRHTGRRTGGRSLFRLRATALRDGIAAVAVGKHGARPIPPELVAPLLHQLEQVQNAVDDVGAAAAAGVVVDATGRLAEPWAPHTGARGRAAAVVCAAGADRPTGSCRAGAQRLLRQRHVAGAVSEPAGGLRRLSPGGAAVEWGVSVDGGGATGGSGGAGRAGCGVRGCGHEHRGRLAPGLSGAGAAFDASTPRDG
eukprot:ctg_227.g126